MSIIYKSIPFFWRYQKIFKPPHQKDRWINLKKRAQLVIAAVLIIFVFYFVSVFAHGSEPEEHEGNMAKSAILREPAFYIKLVLGWLAVVTIFLFTVNKKLKFGNKKILFLIIAVPVVASSLYLAGHTVYENVISVTKGPVHWHAQYQAWACGKRMYLEEAKGLSNKVGSSVLHSHEDNTIHIEGVVYQYSDISLGKFFNAIGGVLEHDMMSLPTMDRIQTFNNGDLCGNTPGNLKVYVNGKKIDQPENYVISPQENVPPGDCILFEFSSDNSDTTSRLCESWAAKGWNYENGGR